MKLHEEIQAVLDKESFSLNPDDWTPLQAHSLEWGRKAFRLVNMRDQIIAVCENSKYRTKHTTMQMCKFLDDLRKLALGDK